MEEPGARTLREVLAIVRGRGRQGLREEKTDESVFAVWRDHYARA